MRFKLTARNRETHQDETISEFNDEFQFDFMLDQVDSQKYESAMITEHTGQFPVCRKYVEYQDYRPYFEIHKKRVKKNGTIRNK